MYISPGMNKEPNWRVIFSWHYLLNQLTSVVFFSLFYFVTLNMFYRLIAGKHKPIQFLQPVVIAFLLLAVYYALSFFYLTNTKFEFSVNNSKIKQQDMTVGILIFSYVMSSIFVIGSSLLIAYLTYLRDDKKQRKILEEQKMQLEIEKSQANLNFLKAQ